MPCFPVYKLLSLGVLKRGHPSGRRYLMYSYCLPHAKKAHKGKKQLLKFFRLIKEPCEM